MLTLDLQILGQRHKDLRNGLSAPPKFTPKHISQMATRPRWACGMLGTKRRTFRNIVGHAKDVGDLASLSSWTTEQFDPQLSWNDVAWIKERWGGKLILKGILDPEDALMAAKTGADAIIVSNHGGRQLDGAPSSISVLSAIVDAVGDQIEVHMDGGIRSGQDVLKALCLGAKGTYIGRPFLYGLGAVGKAGRDQGAGDHPQGNGHHAGAVRQARHHRLGKDMLHRLDAGAATSRRRRGSGWPASIFSTRVGRKACASMRSATCMAGSTCWPLHERIAAEIGRSAGRRWRVIHLGDYVDRGPDSSGVLDFLVEARRARPRNLALAGNHDIGFLDFLGRTPDGLVHRFGGVQTAQSYGVRSASASRPKLSRRRHARLARPCRKAMSTSCGRCRFPVAGDFFFCHAGIRPDVPLDSNSARPDLDPRRLPRPRRPPPKIVVHGHTPVAEPE